MKDPVGDAGFGVAAKLVDHLVRRADDPAVALAVEVGPLGGCDTSCHGLGVGMSRPQREVAVHGQLDLVEVPPELAAEALEQGGTFRDKSGGPMQIGAGSVLRGDAERAVTGTPTVIGG